MDIFAQIRSSRRNRGRTTAVLLLRRHTTKGQAPSFSQNPHSQPSPLTPPLTDWGFDGLDIDWEYPATADEAQHYVLLLQTCRAALDAYAAKSAPGYHFLLTIAAPAGPKNYDTLDLAAMDPFLDAWHLMAYDYAGSWDTTTGHQANLFPHPPNNNPDSTKFSTERAVTDYLARGVPAHKLVLGMPLYGRAFEQTQQTPGRPYTGVGPGTIEPGVYLYRDLPRTGATVLYDDVAKASYSFDAGTKEFVSFDTLQSAKVKVEYLLKKGLGGAVFWEASGDKTGKEGWVGAVGGGVGRLDGRENWLGFPASRYDNIRGGMVGG